MSVYTIKYSKKDGESKIIVLEGETELATFPENHADFNGILESIPIFKEVQDGMDISIAGTIEDFNSKYSLDLDIDGEPDNDSDDNMSEEEKEEDGEVEINTGNEEKTESSEEKSEEEAEGEEKEEGEEGAEIGEDDSEGEIETEDSTEDKADTPDSDHLETDAKHLNDIEGRVTEIEATLSKLSSVFGELEKDAETIDDVVDNMQAEDAAEEGDGKSEDSEFGINTLDSDGFTDALVPSFTGDNGDEASVVYSGTRVWTDPAEDTDPGDAISDEKKEEEVEEDYDMYDEYEQWAEPKKGLRKFKM